MVKNRKTGQLQELLNLASYNYLGISYRPEVKEAAIEAIEKYGLGASGSPILSGTFDIHNELEDEVAAFKDKEAAILFPTGYSANVGFISAIMRSGDNILLDQYSHASIVDGAILAKSNTVFFRHNNPMDLERKLGRSARARSSWWWRASTPWTATSACSPRSSRWRSATERASSSTRPTRRSCSDPTAAAWPEHFGLDKEVDFHLGHLLEEPRRAGRVRVRQPRTSIDYVNAFGRSRFFSCNLAPPMLAAGLLAGLRIVENEPQLRARLWSNVAFLRRRFAEEGIDIGKSTSQVMPVLVNNDAKVFAVAEKIQERGLFLQPRHLSGGAQAQVAPAHLGLGRPHRGRSSSRRCRSSGACSARRGSCRD